MYLILCIVLISGCSQQTETDVKEKGANVPMETEIKDEAPVSESQESVPEESVSEESTSEKSETVAVEEQQFSIRESFVLENVRDYNTLDDDGERTQIIHLPDSYYESDKSYPVIYYFHGFGGSTTEFSGKLNGIRRTTKEGLIPEAIYVAVSYNTSLAGTFMENSEITGHWEDAFIEEIIPYVDANYRTIQAKEGRALMGFSMGGYSVIKLGLNNPDVVNGFFAYGPGCLIDEEFDVAMDSWNGDTRFLRAYGAAFADGVTMNLDEVIPVQDGSDADNALIEAWLEGFGELEQKIDTYLAGDERLASIGLEVGERDYYSWIFTGTKQFHELLEEREIEHLYNQTGGGHSINNSSVVEIALPFLFDKLTVEE